MGWSETTREVSRGRRYTRGGACNSERHKLLQIEAGHRPTVNDAVLVEEGDRLLREGEAVRLVYLEVVKD